MFVMENEKYKWEKGNYLWYYTLSGFLKTVSRVINGGVNVKEETYQAIQKVIELSYIPNAYAKIAKRSYKYWFL